MHTYAHVCARASAHQGIVAKCVKRREHQGGGEEKEKLHFSHAGMHKAELSSLPQLLSFPAGLEALQGDETGVTECSK